MKRTATIARVAVFAAVVGGLAGCKKGTLGDPDAGGAGQISGVGARGASGIGGAGGDNSGFGGAGEIGGRGPGGSGGQGLIDCPPPLPPVCGALCGNGRIDTCVAALAPECITYVLREECDGNDLGRASCAELGYGSGKLVCDKTCSVVAGTGCSECVPTAVVSCGTLPPLAQYISTYAIAATDSEVGLAEVGYSDFGGLTLSFRRLTPSLDTASSTTLLDTSRPGPLEGTLIDGVAVAPIASGWVIASCVSGQVHLFTVDAAGVYSVRAPVTVGDRGCSYGMSLVARPDGGPLLAWAGTTPAGLYGVTAALIAADGQSAGAPFEIIAPPMGDGGTLDGAWVGDAFNVVATAYVMPNNSRALRLARIDVNGTLTSRDLLVGEFDDMPRIARGAADTRVTYVARDEIGRAGTRWRRFGSAGEPLAEAEVARSIYGYTPSPAVAFGDDTLVLVGDDSGRSSLAITRVGGDGNIVALPYYILRAPSFRIANHDMVRRGPDAVISWLSYGSDGPRVGLARITP